MPDRCRHKLSHLGISFARRTAQLVPHPHMAVLQVGDARFALLTALHEFQGQTQRHAKGRFHSHTENEMHYSIAPISVRHSAPDTDRRAAGLAPAVLIPASLTLFRSWAPSGSDRGSTDETIKSSAACPRRSWP